MRASRAVQIALRIILLLLVAACGGNDGSTGASSGSSADSSPSTTTSTAQPPTLRILSGVAAAGIPISGTIILKDGNGAQLGPVTTDMDGSYSFDVSGLTPPFLLKAEWSSDSQTHTLFSAATSPGNVHINPFTNLALMLAGNSDPSLIFGPPGAKPEASRINEASIAAAITKIKNALAPLFNYYGLNDFSPISGSYTATPDNKLDALLDIISIKMENGTVTFTNKLTGSVIATSKPYDLADMAIDMAKLPDKSDLADIGEITEFVGVLCSQMNLGADLTINKLDGMFIPDPYYGTSNGHTRATDVQSIVDIFGPGGSNKDGKLRTIRHVRLVQELTADYSNRGVSKVFLLNYDFIYLNGKIVHGNNVTLGKDTPTGKWKFIGDPVAYSVGNNYGGYISYCGNDVVAPLGNDFAAPPLAFFPQTSSDR
jgi:hypothetical protein